MDKTAIKNYAVKARIDLIEAVKVKAQQFYIFENDVRTASREEILEEINNSNVFLSERQKQVITRLYSELWREGYPHKKDVYNRLIENVAYTWFNRLIALRFMEVNEYLPSNIRILSSQEPGRIEPDAMRESDRLDYVDQRKIAELRADTDINASEKLYKYILIQQCNALSSILPGMFQKIDDYTELLLPDALLAKGGIVYDLVNSVHEDNFNIRKQGQIEIIGWLYQYYISEKKDEVFAALKKNVKINKDTIPAATQLFTPEWIVKYMVENSLGRLWLESNSDDELRAKWKYYVDEAEQEPEVAEQLCVLRSQNSVKRPEDIKLIDPCMGSGHILVYSFDVLFQIYQSVGYSEREIPNLILQNNIYGLDIDDRAGQLAYFALMMKARGYNRRFFRQDNIPQPMVYSAKGDSELEEYGSLLKVAELGEKPELPEQLTLDDYDYEKKLKAWHYRSLLAQKYDIVVTNPPYMGASGMNAKLAEYVKKQYPDSKSDMFAVCIEFSRYLCKISGHIGLITPFVWMYLSSYQKLREKIIKNQTITSMIQLEYNAFEVACVPVCTYTLRNVSVKENGVFIRLSEFKGVENQEPRALYAIHNNNCYYKYTRITYDFLSIPNYPIAYWASEKIFQIYREFSFLNIKGKISEGIKTGENEKFIRYWHEININKFSKANQGEYKWYPHVKGGDFRKWYGNLEYVINWENDGFEIKSIKNSGIQGKDILFKEFICWSKITNRKGSFRYVPDNYLFDSGNPAFKPTENLFIYLAYLNSCIVKNFLYLTNPTLNCQVSDIGGLPFIKYDSEQIIKNLAEQNISISRADWDSFETSWDFQTHPLVNFREEYPLDDVSMSGETRTYPAGSYSLTLVYDDWRKFADIQFQNLKSNEEELNRIFIGIYGLQDELTPEVDDKDVTVRKADLAREIRSFISYAVGCMFGRYSLDEDGLVFAGGKFDKSRYITFKPVDDNIIPINSNDYFDIDIVLRFVEFVRAVYGDETLGENLSFIADALYPNGNGTAQEKIRRYFLNDFYKDHVKIYQKRPIYWLFDSGKKDGFKALFYLHRYDKYTVMRARTDYLHPLQRKYDAEIKRLDTLSGESADAREKAVYRKEIEVLQGKMDECRIYDQVVSHIAHQQIELDLDDGVKINYEKFQGVEVPKDNGKTEIMDLLGKI